MIKSEPVPPQKVFPCWVCQKDLGQIPANLLLSRWSEDGLRREYRHRQDDRACGGNLTEGVKP